MAGLRDAVERVTRKALHRGALEPLATDREVVEDAGVAFVVHVLTRLEHKAHATAEQKKSGTNPFLPPDPELFVAGLGEHHYCVLNKFNVIDHHLLIVTRRFEPQEALLERRDFEALALCMAEVGGLGFYNSHAVSGASQAHRHLQVVPLPLGPGPEATPFDGFLKGTTGGEKVERSRALPFPHALWRLSGDPTRAADAVGLHDWYRALLGAVGICGNSQPYNLLVTDRWMLVVPRRREHSHGISVNALGFAGSLLVPDRDHLELIRRVGPMTVLAEVAGSAVGGDQPCPYAG